MHQSWICVQKKWPVSAQTKNCDANTAPPTKTDNEHKVRGEKPNKRTQIQTKSNTYNIQNKNRNNSDSKTRPT